MTYPATYFTAFTSDMLSHRFVTTSLKADDSKFSEQLDYNSHVVDKDDFGNTVPCSTSRMLNMKLVRSSAQFVFLGTCSKCYTRTWRNEALKASGFGLSLKPARPLIMAK